MMVISDVFMYDCFTGRAWFLEFCHLDFIHFTGIAIYPKNFKYTVRTRLEL